MDKKYLYVLDKQIAETLIKDGLKPLSITGQGTATIWVFENLKNYSFTKEQSQKIHYSNTLRMCF